MFMCRMIVVCIYSIFLLTVHWKRAEFKKTKANQPTIGTYNTDLYYTQDGFWVLYFRSFASSSKNQIVSIHLQWIRSFAVQCMFTEFDHQNSLEVEFGQTTHSSEIIGFPFVKCIFAPKISVCEQCFLFFTFIRIENIHRMEWKMFLFWDNHLIREDLKFEAQ